MKRKGISTFIATLLLMVLAVSAGVVIYAYTMGYLGGFGGTESLGAMSVDTYSGSETNITAYVRNIGGSTLNITRVYIDGELGTGECESIQHHLDQCPKCQSFIKSFTRNIELCKEHLKVDMPEELRLKLRQRLQDEYRQYAD